MRKKVKRNDELIIINDYAKMSSSSYRASDVIKVETHWVENLNTGERYDIKLKVIDVKSGAQ